MRIAKNEPVVWNGLGSGFNLYSMGDNNRHRITLNIWYLKTETITMAIVPVAKAMFLCDFHIGYSNGKVDLYGLFNAIRPEHRYPYNRGQFCVFAQLINGLGSLPFFIDVRFAETDELIYTTEIRTIEFPDRNTIIQVAMRIEGCEFTSPGLYLLELFCDNTWVCDTQILLR